LSISLPEISVVEADFINMLDLKAIYIIPGGILGSILD